MNTTTSRSKETGQTSLQLLIERVSVVIPVHNEAENVPPLYEEIDSVFRRDEMFDYRPYEVIFVEDGSDDGTKRIIDELAREREEVVSIHLSRNWGQSAALSAGFDAANGDIIIPMDGDLQNDPNDIPELLSKLEEGYDCVSGYRNERNDPWTKTVPSRIQTYLAKFTGPDINDFGCTLKAYRREAIDSIDLYGEGHRYIPAKLYKNGFSVTEIPVNHRERKHGESRYGIGRLIRGFVDLIYHYFHVHYSTRPMHLLGGIGIVAMGVGGTIGLISVIQKYAFGIQLEPRTPRLILTALLIIFGLQLLVFGFLAEMVTSMKYKDETEYRIESVIE